MRPLQEFLIDARQLTEAAFLARHPSPFLIHRLKNAGGPDISSETVVSSPMQATSRPLGDAVLSLSVANTRALVHLTKVMSSLGGGGDAQPALGAAVVFPLRGKAPGEVSVGRGSEADVPLPFPKISKVHARFAVHAEGHVLCDAGSRNGTRINGVAVPPGEWRPVPAEALIQLSEYQFLFYSPLGFYRLLCAS